MNSILYQILSTLAILVSSCVFATAQDTVHTKFSVYLLPSARESADSSFKRVKDIHYTFGDKNIPLSLKEARQSMAYPYTGPSKLSLFHIESKNGEESRLPLCSTSIPAGAKYGVLILHARKNGKYGITPYWYNNKDLNGDAHLINLTGKTMAFKIKEAKKPLIVKHKGNAKLKGKFDGKNGDAALLFLDGYIQTKRGNGRVVATKAVYTNLLLKKNDANLVLLLPKQRKTVRTLSLNAKGVPNKRTLSELQKYLPGYMKEKGKDAKPQASQVSAIDS